jgi:hypothetical protein
LSTPFILETNATYSRLVDEWVAACRKITARLEETAATPREKKIKEIKEDNHTTAGGTQATTGRTRPKTWGSGFLQSIFCVCPWRVSRHVWHLEIGGYRGRICDIGPDNHAFAK